MNLNSLLKILYFDLPKVNVKIRNTLCIIISSYISCTWYNRDNLDNIINVIKGKLARDQGINLKILGEKACKIFTEKYVKDIKFIYKL